MAKSPPATTLQQQEPQHNQRRRWQVRARHVYHWSSWGFVVLLQLTQVLGGLKATQDQRQHMVYGKSPLDGIYDIPGTNDEPFTDRALVCNRKGRLYKPQQLSSALSSAGSSSNNSSAKGKNGYRVLHRTGLVLSPDVRDYYANTCSQIAATIANIHGICRTLGYEIASPTEQQLRIVVDRDDSDEEPIVTLSATLPILILPYWDNALFARYVVPGEDGSACMIRLGGSYEGATTGPSILRAVNRTVRETKTVEWLGLGGGTWRHGWYEHQGNGGSSRWYSDVISTDKDTDPYDILGRHFDTATTGGGEMDCDAKASQCTGEPPKEWWGNDLLVMQYADWYHSVTITNGKRLGLFLYEDTSTRHVTSIYRLETLIANVSMSYLLFRWLVALVAMRHNDTAIGVASLACVRSFHLLPLVLLPRLKSILAVFCSVGCHFEGDQKSLGEAFFVMYPAIAEFGVLLYSLLNLLAKLLRRRMSDVLFGPMLMVLCVVHYLRFEIAHSGWFEMDGRVTTVVTASEFEATRLVDFFTTKLALRMNGGILSLFVFKLVLLALQLVPLVWFTDSSRPRNKHGQRISQAETAMALRVARNGGLGKSLIYHGSSCAERRPPSIAKVDAIVPFGGGSDNHQQQLPQQQTTSSKRRSSHKQQHQQQQRPLAIVPYEVVRAGFVVLGDDMALVAIHDWCWFMVSAPLRMCHVPMHHMQMLVWTLTREETKEKYAENKEISSTAVHICRVSERPRVCCVTDQRFDRTHAWDIKAHALE